jgi:hypothetical protein
VRVSSNPPSLPPPPAASPTREPSLRRGRWRDVQREAHRRGLIRRPHPARSCPEPPVTRRRRRLRPHPRPVYGHPPRATPSPSSSSSASAPSSSSASSGPSSHARPCFPQLLRARREHDVRLSRVHAQQLSLGAAHGACARGGTRRAVERQPLDVRGSVRYLPRGPDPLANTAMPRSRRGVVDFLLHPMEQRLPEYRRAARGVRHLRLGLHSLPGVRLVTWNYTGCHQLVFARLPYALVVTPGCPVRLVYVILTWTYWVSYPSGVSTAK